MRSQGLIYNCLGHEMGHCFFFLFHPSVSEPGLEDGGGSPSKISDAGPTV